MDYYLIPNKLTNDGNYIARLAVSETYTEAELIDKMLSKRNMVSKPDLEGVIAAMKETLVEIIEEGKGLNLPWLKLGYGIKGTFATPETTRNPDDHPLEISVTAGSLLTKAVPEIKLERVSAPDFGPEIKRFTDGVSKTVNSLLTPGGVFEITGERLRVGGRDSAVIGLYLRAKDGAETRVEVLLCNDPSCLTGQLPADLPSGAYQLVVKTQVGVNGNRFVNGVRTAVSTFSLRVE